MSSKDRVNVASLLLISAPYSAVHAVRCVRLAEEAIQIDNNVDACILLATILNRRPSFPGLRRDVRRAILLLENAVTLGSEIACAKLGRIHLQASGVPQNKPRALGLFERVAESHPIFPSIRRALAFLLICQEPGVHQDEAKAARLLQETINENHCVYTKYVLATILARPRGNIQYDGVRAIPLLEDMVRDRDHDDATLLLGILLSKHSRGERDTNRAISLLQTAVERNVPRSKAYLAKALLCTGDPTWVEQGIHLCEELIEQRSCIMAHVFLADYLSGYKEGRVSDGLDDNRACQLYYRALVITFGNNAQKLQDVGLHPDNSYEPHESEAVTQDIAHAIFGQYHRRALIDLAMYSVCGIFPVEMDKAERMFLVATKKREALGIISTRVACFLRKLEWRLHRAPMTTSIRARIRAVCLRVCQRMEIFPNTGTLYGVAKRLHADVLLKGEGDIDVKTRRKAIQMYTTAAELGNPEALLSLGNMKYLGEYSESKSDADAFVHFAQVIQLRLPKRKRHISHEAIIKMATIGLDYGQRRRQIEAESPEDKAGTEESLVL